MSGFLDSGHFTLSQTLHLFLAIWCPFVFLLYLSSVFSFFLSFFFQFVLFYFYFIFMHPFDHYLFRQSVCCCSFLLFFLNTFSFCVFIADLHLLLQKKKSILLHLFYCDPLCCFMPIYSFPASCFFPLLRFFFCFVFSCSHFITCIYQSYFIIFGNFVINVII